MKTYIPMTRASRALVLAERDHAAARTELLKWSVIALCLLAAALLGGCQSAPVAQAHPQAGYFSKVSYTGSMYPALKGGETIYVTPCAFDRLKTGMIVVYVNHSGLRYIHRLQLLKRDGWTVKGDANRAADYLVPGMDELVTPENFVGIWIDGRDKRTYP